MITAKMIASAVQRADGLLLGDLTGTIEYRCVDGEDEVFRHFQAFDAGRLVDWRLGAADRPSLCLRQSSAANLAMLARTGSGNEVIVATMVVDDNSGVVTWPPPLDEVWLDWGRSLPVLSTTGELTVEQTLTRSPFGDVTTFFRIDRGRIAGCGVGHVDRADVVIERTYRLAVLERMGCIDMMESASGGAVHGDVQSVSLFLGGYETDECVEARRGLVVPNVDCLIALGEALCSRAWGEVSDGLVKDSR